MNVENMSASPTQDESRAESPPDATISSDNPVSSPTDQKATPEQEPRLGGSEANAFQHGCSSTGKVMHPLDHSEVDYRFTILRLTYSPGAPREEDLLLQAA